MIENSKYVLFWKRVFKRKIVIGGAITTLLFVLIAVFAPVLTSYDPNVIDATTILSGPTKEHLLGTDMYGRDLLTRIFYGTRVSLLTGVVATLLAAVVGCFIGMAAAFFGGIVDKLCMAFCDIFNSIPQIALSMTLLTLLGGGVFNMTVILCLGALTGFIRMMRASALSIMGSDYIQVAKLSGQSPFKTLVKHVLPNSISPIIVLATQNVGGTIMLESGLSLLGIGIKAPTASWGSILNEARPHMMTNPIYIMAPCVFLAVLIIGLNVFGDGLRDALDPTLHNE